MELTDDQKQRIPPGDLEQAPKLEGKSKEISFARTLLGVAGLLAVIVIFSNLMHNPSLGSAPSDQLATTMYVPEKQTITTGSLQVPAHGNSFIRIVVTPVMSHPRIVGRFDVSGGSGNDIEAGITTGESEHLNYINGHQASGLWFTPGKVTSESFNLPAKPGTYYLEFNNKFSAFTAKTVSVDASIAYQRFRDN